MFALLIAGCATPGQRAPDAETSAYRAVTEAVARDDCTAARSALTAMEARHADSRRMPDAYLEVAYGCLRVGEFDAAENLVVTFLERFPGHPSEEYGRYLNALVAYARWRALPPESPGSRSAAEARKAFGRFRVLLINHPDTAYASDVRPLLVDLRSGLARAEVDTIRDDLAANRYDAVISRARYVLTYYGNTDSAPYALAALVSVHRARGEVAEARRLLQQLESDWPDHPVLEALGPSTRGG